MLRLWHVFADVKTAEDLNLPAPQLAERADGQRAPNTVLIEASAEMRAYVQELGRRAELVRSRSVTPEEDNMLKISTDGRKAALDMRLVAGQPPDGSSKLQIAADTIAGLHHRYRDAEYVDAATGERSAIPGALQIVFCDLSTPAPDRWNAYHELRALLEARGLPPASVRFIHEARNDLEKARLFAACRAGHVSVLVGSTEKMGIGTNIQDRCIAIHHVDVPWRPADIEQRDGRGVRQGNQNPEIHIVRYAVEGSFDAYSWQTVERKARFINQIMRGRLDVREIEDIGENALSFAEVKALASGDPLILEKARVDADVTRLARLERAWQRSHHALRATIATAQDSAGVLGRQHAAVTAALVRRRSTRGDAFVITIDGHQATDRTHAAKLITARLQRLAPGPARPIGELGCLPVDAQLAADPVSGAWRLELSLHGLPSRPATLAHAQLTDNAPSLLRQLEHRLDTLPQLADELQQRRRAHLREASTAREQLARPFKHAQQLADARQQQQQLQQAMSDRQQPAAAEPQTQPPAPPAHARVATPPAAPARPLSAPVPPRHSGPAPPRVAAPQPRPPAPRR
ncbi:MAG: helicase C-terminal domain-containing protein [Solirubrobacteraceae bacterium]